MHIGIVPSMYRGAGGVYQYSLNVLRALCAWRLEEEQDEFTLFVSETSDPILLDRQGWAIKPLMDTPSRPSSNAMLAGLRTIVGEGPHRVLWRRIRQYRNHKTYRAQFRPDAARWLGAVDLMFYLFPHPLSFETRIPFLMPIHDLQHRLQPEFPEVSADGQWENREYLFRNGARYATLLLADSEIGKEDILNCYGSFGVTADRVKVLPYLPASYLTVKVPQDELQRVRAIYHLPERYLFYPAQFWPHKNHARILQALSLLKDRGMKMPIVFCGTHSGAIRQQTFEQCLSLSSKLGLEKQVHYLDYVPDEDMSGLYAGAMALIMPTFFGPTNIPVLEAWAFGCPVLTSDIRGIREQVGDAALLVDPSSAGAIAEGIYQLCTDESLRAVLVQRAHASLATYTPENHQRRLIEIVKEAKVRVQSEPRRYALS